MMTDTPDGRDCACALTEATLHFYVNSGAMLQINHTVINSEAMKWYSHIAVWIKYKRHAVCVQGQKRQQR